MKNRLTTEEQKLQSKLNEASFEYSDANWVEIQSAVSKKGVLTNLSPLLKAGLVFSVFIGAVFLMNELYTEERQLAPATQDFITNEAPSTLQDKVEEVKEAEESQAQENNLIHSNKNVDQKQDAQQQSQFKTTPESNTTHSDVSAKNAQEITTNTVLEEIEMPESTNSEFVTINSIEILSPTCINSAITFKADLTKNVQEDLYYQWFINGKEIEGQTEETSYQFTQSGNYTLTLNVFYEGNDLAKHSRLLTIDPAPSLNFIATDLTSLFYDQNVNVKVVNPIAGEYKWLDENNAVHFGKESVFSFQNEGIHQIRLEHTSLKGCKTKIKQDVSMKKDFIEAFPNTFTPDNDGLNDVFVLTAFQGLDFKSFKLLIVNQNGEPVFQTTDPYEGWNNRLQNSGDFLPSGNYAWSVEVENNNGRKKTFKGKIKTDDF